MVFNSAVFGIFLVIVFALYWGAFSRRVRAQNILLVIASYIFYGWWDWRFLSLLFISSLIDFLIGLKLPLAKTVRHRKILLGISLFSNLGMLLIFKYYDFFIQSFLDLSHALGIQAHAGTLHIILPVGISFYTFQTLSYTIDIYRKKLDPTKDVVSFFAFVSFFPQLVAGPIERAAHLLPQFQKNRVVDYPQLARALRLMLWGFFKKIVIADNVAMFSDAVFSGGNAVSGLATCVGILAFALQIYCDFSGYTDIARGCAALFGFDIMLNFRTPYFASSPRAFWQRWHISLSTWFRDYVYIPLGGNRAGNRRMYVNLMATFLLSGLWHGAHWTFVVWGALHGAAVVIQHISDKWRFSMPAFLSGALLFVFVCFAWVFFRASDLTEACSIIRHIFYPTTQADWNALLVYAAPWLNVLVSVLLFILVEMLMLNKTIVRAFVTGPKYRRWAMYYLCIFWILYFGAIHNAPAFIYFQF